MMTGVRWPWIVALAACGRIDFDRHGSPPDTGGDIPPDTVPDVAIDCATAQAQSPPGGWALWLDMDRIDPESQATLDKTGHMATCPGGCPVMLDHACHRGLLFSGQEYLRIEWDPSLDVSGGFTVAVWARLDRDLDGSDACAVTEPNQSEPTGNSYSLCVFARNRAVYDFTTSAGQGDSQQLTDPLAIMEWHHLAMTWDASSRVKSLYVDGSRMDTRAGIDIRFDHAPLGVGADLEGFPDNVAPAGFWTGALDDLLLYTRALDDTEIRALAAPP
jgi:hypothetical protein